MDHVDRTGQYCGSVDIYKLTAPNGKCYVGQVQHYRRNGRGRWCTRGFAGRWSEHQHESRKGPSRRSHCRFLYHSIRKYGAENFKTEVLAVVPKAQANQAEVDWIKSLDTLAPKGLNLTSGGDVTVYSKEACERISMALKNKPFNEAEQKRRNLARAARRKLPPLVTLYSSGNWRGYRVRLVAHGKMRTASFCSANRTPDMNLALAVVTRDKWLREAGRCSFD